MRPNGLILYRGASKIDGQPIVVILTGIGRKSKNGKTGDMLQAWILSDTVSPLSAAIEGQNNSVCGDCPLKSFIRPDGSRTLGACYVNLGRAPANIWKAYQRGAYTVLNKREHAQYIKGRTVRFGAYGDPAAVPVGVWNWLAKHAKHWTGYTHQWRKCHPCYARFCMASCETVEDRELAKSKGYRTFRIRQFGGSLVSGEIACPADKYVRGNRTCEQCRACSGVKRSSRAADVVITVHGEPWKIDRFVVTPSAVA